MSVKALLSSHFTVIPFKIMGSRIKKATAITFLDTRRLNGIIEPLKIRKIEFSRDLLWE